MGFILMSGNLVGLPIHSPAAATMVLLVNWAEAHGLPNVR
jgi:hypothetical protein